MPNKTCSFLITFSLLLAPGLADAHVMLMPSSAVAGTSTILQFHVEHGCGEAATTALRIDIPASLHAVQPQPKPGWTISRDGGAIVWRGASPGAHIADSFEIALILPNVAGEMVFPVTQTCGTTVENWSELPDSGPAPLK